MGNCIKVVNKKRPTNKVKAQSAIEYMLSYSWAIIVVAVVFVLLYLFVFVPGTIAPNTCTFSNGANCQAIVFGSNSQNSAFAVLLSNNQQFAIINPILYINTTQYGVLTATCAPNLILPGGAMICSNTISTTSSPGSLVYGKVILQAIPCPSTIYNQCTSGNIQDYAGTFSTHSQPILSSTPISITLSTTNTTQLIGGGYDPLIATVKMLGYPVTGATVVYSAVTNPQYAQFSPNVTTTTSNGTAVSEFSGLGNAATGTEVQVKATYAGVDSNIVTITLQAPVGVTFTLNPAQMSGVSATTTVLTIDSMPYVYSQFTNGELTVNLAPNSQHTYSFSSGISAGTGIQYGNPSFDNNCGVSSAAGQLSVGTAGCSTTVNYKLQYYLTITQSGDGTSYTLSPSSGWQDAGSLITINEQLSDSINNVALGWTGTSSYSCPSLYCYTGSATSNTFTMNSPTTEQANINAIYSLTLKIASSTTPTMETGVNSNTIVSLTGAGIPASLTYSQFPYTVRVISGNSISYTYQSGVQASTNDGIRYLFTSTKTDNSCATGSSVSGSITVSGTCTELTGNYQPQDQISFAAYNSIDFSVDTAVSNVITFGTNRYTCTTPATSCVAVTQWQNYNTPLAYSYVGGALSTTGGERWIFASTTGTSGCSIASTTANASTVTPTSPCTVTAYETKQFLVSVSFTNVTNPKYFTSADPSIPDPNFFTLSGISNGGINTEALYLTPGSYSYSFNLDNTFSGYYALYNTDQGYVNYGPGGAPNVQYKYRASDGGCGFTTSPTTTSGSITVGLTPCSATVVFVSKYSLVTSSTDSCTINPAQGILYYESVGTSTPIGSTAMNTCGVDSFGYWSCTGSGCFWGSTPTTSCPTLSGYTYEGTSGGTCYYCADTISNSCGTGITLGSGSINGCTYPGAGRNCLYALTTSPYSQSGTTTYSSVASITSWSPITQQAHYTSPPTTYTASCSTGSYIQTCLQSGQSYGGLEGEGCWTPMQPLAGANGGSVTVTNGGCMMYGIASGSTGAPYEWTDCFVAGSCGYQWLQLKDTAMYNTQSCTGTWTCTNTGSAAQCGSSYDTCLSGSASGASTSCDTCTSVTMTVKDCQLSYTDGCP